MDRNDAERILQDLVQINTAGANELAVADYLQALLANHGIVSQLVPLAPKRVGLIAEIGNGQGPTLAFDGHADTVALGDLNKWDVDPLSGNIIDGRMYGRGTTDMKAGLVAGILAMLRLHERQTQLNGTFKLFVTVGEESGETGAEQMVELGLANGIDALITGEPSGISLEYMKKIPTSRGLRGVIMDDDIHDLVKHNRATEQHFLQIAHKGALAYQVVSAGKAVHSSMPFLGVNAIDGLLAFANRQQALFSELKNTAKNDILGVTTPVITQMSGGEQPNTVPGSAEMTVFVRTIPEISQADIIARIEAIIADLNATEQAHLQLIVKFKHAPVYSKPTAKLNALAKNIAQRHLHQVLPFIGAAGGTDASQFVKANPDMDILIFGPGNLTAHQVNEYVDLSMFHAFTDIYEELIEEYLQ